VGDIGDSSEQGRVHVIQQHHRYRFPCEYATPIQFTAVEQHLPETQEIGTVDSSPSPPMKSRVLADNRARGVLLGPDHLADYTVESAYCSFGGRRETPFRACRERENLVLQITVKSLARGDFDDAAENIDTDAITPGCAWLGEAMVSLRRAW
jgi:hypothetical protein